MSIISEGDFFFTVTPRRRTSSGSLASAIATRFCTRTCAVSRFVPTSKETVRTIVPSLADCDCM